MDIAIIGIAGRFPEAQNLDDFFENLKNGVDSIRPLSEERLRRMSMPISNEYQSIAWLEDVDLFDHSFFKISLGEAQNMDPHQRIALELTYAAMENSGYNPFSFAGSETAVYVADVSLEYYQLAQRLDATLLTGNLNSIMAGRIARFFDLRGEAIMIDTSCSSSLVAVHHACQALKFGDAEQTVVCGVKVRIFPSNKTPFLEVGIDSEDGKTRSYSNGANGTGSGEAGACIILKPLKKALADKDIIHAIIKGSAVNQDAGQSGSLTAPSSVAQSKVIEKAWKKAKIDPSTITFIEGHGTATKLGDPIEVEGLNMAFEKFAVTKNHCSLSSVKSNIGHTDTAAGMAGLVKTVLSLKSKKIFPTVHFDAPNPFIDFNDSYVSVDTIYRDWNVGFSNLRRAGVSSFGLSGTNCHVILEEAPDRKKPINTGKWYAIPVSGFTYKSLISNLKQLKKWLKANKGESIATVSYTLCTGKPHFDYRHILLADSIGQAIENIDDSIENLAARKRENLSLVFSHNPLITDSLIEQLVSSYPEFARWVKNCRGILNKLKLQENQNFKIFCFQYSLFKLLKSKSITTKNLIGEGVGEITITAITGRTTLRNAIRKACNYCENHGLSLPDKCAEFMNTLSDDEVLMELGPVSSLSLVFSSVSSENLYRVIGIDPSETDYLLNLVKQLYTVNYQFEWAPFFDDEECYKVELPTYTFDRVRCWIRDETDVFGLEDSIISDSNEVYSDYLDEVDFELVKETVIAAWKEVLRQDEIVDDDDFFNIGGHSLNGTQMLNHIKQTLKVDLDIDDLFDYSTISSLSQYIFSACQKNQTVGDSSEIKVAKPQDDYPLTPTQKRFWVLQQIEKGMLAYNMPGAYFIKGPLNIDAFVKAFDTVIERHESLRTTFLTVNGEPRQKVNDGHNFQLKLEDMKGFGDAELKANQLIKKQAREPFDLENGPLIKSSLYQIEDDKFLIFYSLHHIIADGLSIEILTRDVLKFYDSYCKKEYSPPDSLRIQYHDYVLWLEQQLRGNHLDETKEYWIKEFSPLPPRIQLPVDLKRPNRQTFHGDKLNLVLNEQLTAKLKILSKDNNCTMFMTVLACINMLLCKISNQYDIVIGSPLSGRDHPDLENQIGLFLNTIAIRLIRSKEEVIADILQSVRYKMLQSFKYQYYPFDCVLEDISYERDPSRNSLFDIGFTHSTIGQLDMELENGATSNLQIEPVKHGFKSVKADLWFHWVEMFDKAVITLDYNTDIFLPATINKILLDMEMLMQYIIEHPKDTLQQLIENLGLEEQEEKLRDQSAQRARNKDLLKNISKIGDKNI